MAGGAEGQGVDVLIRHAGLGQLPAEDALEVHGELAVRQGGAERLHALAQPLGHGRGHIVVGLEAAGPDAGADGHQNVMRVTAVPGGQLLHGLGRDAQAGTPPAGVDSGNGFFYRVVEQDGDAVGVIDRQAQAGNVGHEAVGVIADGLQESFQHMLRLCLQDRVLVDLVGHHQMVHVRPKGGAEAPVVFQHILGIIPPGHAQVELVKGRFAHAADPGGKAMGDAPGGGEGVGGVEHHALVGLLGE